MNPLWEVQGVTEGSKGSSAFHAGQTDSQGHRQGGTQIQSHFTKSDVKEKCGLWADSDLLWGQWSLNLGTPFLRLWGDRTLYRNGYTVLWKWPK